MNINRLYRQSLQTVYRGRNPHHRPAAFTLVELMVVMAIVAVISTFAGPSFQSLIFGTNMMRAGQIAGDEIALARQEAVCRNRDVEVRFYKFKTASGPDAWRAIQIVSVIKTASGTEVRPLSRVSILPEGVVIAEDKKLSPLLGADSTVAGKTQVQGTAGVEYSGFRIRQSGTLESTITPANNFITLVKASANTSASANTPGNFYTVQINPITCKVNVFRP